MPQNPHVGLHKYRETTIIIELVDIIKEMPRWIPVADCS